MGEILFLAHRIPFPPDRGDKIRSHHILQRLARIAPVHVGTFADDVADHAEEAALAVLASSYRLVNRSKPVAWAGLQALAAGSPVNLPAFYDRSLAEWVEEVLARRAIAAIYVFSAQMGQYVPEDFGGRVVVDFVDADSAKFGAYAARSGWPMRWVYSREERLFRAEEARLAARADVSLLISHAEAALFRSRLTPAAVGRAEVRVLANGIDSQAFDPALVIPEPRMLACPGPRLIFTGQMDYPPNVDAALRAIDRILPLVRARFPQASLHVVGRSPAPALLARHGADGCHVWGRVEDVQPWLKAADCALVPLEIARGVQNKVLEAMAMALPVVLTSGAVTGIDATDGQLQVADSDAALAAAAIALLSDPGAARTMGSAARRFVVERMSWQAALAPLPQILGLPDGLARDAA